MKEKFAESGLFLKAEDSEEDDEKPRKDTPNEDGDEKPMVNGHGNIMFNNVLIQFHNHQKIILDAF